MGYMTTRGKIKISYISDRCVITHTLFILKSPLRVGGYRISGKIVILHSRLYLLQLDEIKSKLKTMQSCKKYFGGGLLRSKISNPIHEIHENLHNCALIYQCTHTGRFLRCRTIPQIITPPIMNRFSILNTF